MSTRFNGQRVSFVDLPVRCTVPRPHVERHLTSLPALERAAEVLRFSAARLEHWLSPGGGLRAALCRALLVWCLLVIVGLLVAPMVTLVLGQVVVWTGLLAFVIQQLMVFPRAIGACLWGANGGTGLGRRRCGRKPPRAIHHHPVKTKIICESLSGDLLRRATRAAARFGLRQAGAILRAGAPHAVHTAERLEALSEHPKLKSPPFFRV